jgi:hypothetical protein
MDKVKHIPERGCHNCRLHCVNHKECASEDPCKQGMEWRPIVKSQPQQQRAKEILKDFTSSLKNYSCSSVDTGFGFERAWHLTEKQLCELIIFARQIKD